MAEEHSYQSPPEAHRLCANNCGFFGSPATLNLCSKCYRDFCLNEEQASSAKFAVEKSLSDASSLSSSSSTTTLISPPALSLPETTTITTDPVTPVTLSATSTPSELPPPVPASQPNRCSTCRKRVGLTGFRCRCGTTFCGTHRYPEQHDCVYDYKAEGRESISKANPVVKAEKLEKI